MATVNVKESTQTKLNQEGTIQEINEHERSYLVEAWKQSVDIQKHFNELSLKVRHSAVTALGAGLAATGLLVNEDYSLLVSTKFMIIVTGVVIWTYLAIQFSNWTLVKTLSNYFTVMLETSISQSLMDILRYFFKIRQRFYLVVDVATAYFIFKYYVSEELIDYYYLKPNYSLNMGGVCLFALGIVIILFYVLDKYWYHKSVKGALDNSVEVENKLSNAGIDGFRLATNIKLESAVRIGNLKFDSDKKLDLVYIGVICLLLVASTMLAFNGNSLVGKDPETLAKINEKAEKYRIDYLKEKSEKNKLTAKYSREIDSLRFEGMMHQREHELSVQTLALYKQYTRLDTTLLKK
jgi:hypothetical protein